MCDSQTVVGFLLGLVLGTALAWGWRSFYSSEDAGWSRMPKKLDYLGPFLGRKKKDKP